jgi:pilus assembly protein CpaC
VLAGMLAALSGCFAFAPALAAGRAEATTTIVAQKKVQIDVSGGALIRSEEDVGTAFVADPSIADIQAPGPAGLFLFGKKPGRTTLFLLDKQGAPMAAYRVDVRYPEGELDAQIQADSGGGARLSYTPNGAVLKGQVPDAQTADRLMQTAVATLGAGLSVVNQLRVAGPAQVNLRVRVAEVSRSVSRQLGFNWSTIFSSGDFALGLQTGRLAGAASGSSLVASGLDGVFGTVSSSHVNGAGVLDAMASEGLVNLLAEPNLTAESGSTATFLAGGEIPIPISQAFGTVSIEYKQYGISIAFTPTVLGTGAISMKVRPEVSQIDTVNTVQLAPGTQVPALTTRRAETTVEIASGQSFAIAGLIQSNDSNNVQKLPWLGDIPVIGALFRSTQFQRNQSELVIVVTPYVVRPTGPEASPDDPTGYLRVPSDAETAIHGRTAAPGRKAVLLPPLQAIDADGLTLE